MIGNWKQLVWHPLTLLLFGLLALVAVVAILEVARRRRLSVMRMKIEERLKERTRIACDLHDTLLQTLEGSKLLVDWAHEDINDLPKMQKAVLQLSVFLEKAMEEGREALESLQAPVSASNDVGALLHRASLEVAPSNMRVIAETQGAPRALQPYVRYEALRIAKEAIRNACQHSRGYRLRIHVQHGREFSVSVIDNGIGMSKAVMANGKSHRFGIPGMRERARKIGCALDVEAASGGGTTVTFKAPSELAYVEGAENSLENLILKIRSMTKRFIPLSSASDDDDLDTDDESV